MNRRSFLRSSASAGLAAAALQPVSLGKAYGQSSGSNPDLYNSSATAHAIMVGNNLVIGPQASDYTNIANVLTKIHTDWVTNAYDIQLQNAFTQLTPASYQPQNFNYPDLASRVGMFQPTVTQAQLQSLPSQHDLTQDADVNIVMLTLQSSGFAFYINQMAYVCNTVASSLAGSPSSSRVGMQPGMRPPIDPDPIGGGGSLLCGRSVTASLGAAAIAFGTIGLMSTAEFIGIGVISAPFWAPLAAFGGLAVIGAVGAHLVACGE